MNEGIAMQKWNHRYGNRDEFHHYRIECDVCFSDARYEQPTTIPESVHLKSCLSLAVNDFTPSSFDFLVS